MILDDCTPMLSISEVYEADNVTVTMEWAHEVDVTSDYTVEVLPLVPIMFNGRTNNCSLVLQYNTKYNFIVMATGHCGDIALITLHYGEVLCCACILASIIFCLVINIFV